MAEQEQDSFIVNSLLLYLGMTGAWFLLYFIIERWIPKTKGTNVLDTKNRVISIIHGLASFLIAVKMVVLQKSGFNERNTSTQEFAMLLSSSYFTYDLIACYIYGLFDTDLLVHHLITIGGIVVSYFPRYGGTAILHGLLVAEVSNSPMHLRKILDNYGLKHTRAYEYMERTYIILYLVFRSIGGPYIVINCYLSSNVSIAVTIATVGLTIQSYLFFGTMFSILKRKMKHRKERKQKKVPLWWMAINPGLYNLEYMENREVKEKIF